jgi:uncharacterized membrane protein YfcA
MSNAKTGIWSAIGALAGGALGALAGKTAVESRPRSRYAYAPRQGRRGPGGADVEDGMVVGGAAGAVFGAFLGGAIAGEETPPQPPQLQK